MVQFGGIASSSSIPRRRKRRKGTIRIPRLKVQNIIIALVVLLILRSFMIQHDGRQGREEGLQELKEGGLSPEEIKNFFPVSMKALKKEKLGQLVHTDEEKRADALKDVRSEVLKKMDSVHLAKRLEKEAELDKENPDFVPTRKLRGGSK
ncbi:unnamed protein product [Cylindrotheca closterium]|uniref:Transmembrane protein n=1 Tax=Cylindrotheca closterium TaxID=2856 RepID=A0AAD2G3A3_9STRA|nr:unnamed protein product [Cylindrotheca closterium]